MCSFGDQGLRTLLCAVGERDVEWWTGANGWGPKFEQMRKASVLEGPEEEEGAVDGNMDDDRDVLLFSPWRWKYDIIVLFVEAAPLEPVSVSI